MLDAMASLLTFNSGMYFASGESPKRRGNVHPTISPYETFEASDGWFNVGVANDKFWSLFCDVIERNDIETDARFDAAPKRAAGGQSDQSGSNGSARKPANGGQSGNAGRKASGAAASGTAGQGAQPSAHAVAHHGRAAQRRWDGLRCTGEGLAGAHVGSAVIGRRDRSELLRVTVGHPGDVRV